MDGEMNPGDEWESTFGNFSMTPTGRFEALCEKRFLSDVCFVVGSSRERIPAHKLILATASPVFHSMFYGQSVKVAIIEVLDIEADPFKHMLSYVYTSQFDPKLSDVPALLKCANKYEMPGISKQCAVYLKSNDSPKVALYTLNQIISLDEPESIEICLKLIDSNAVQTMEMEDFCDINLETLKSIISRDTFVAKEISILAGATRWAVAECGRRDWIPHASNCREALQDALYHIRFSLIPQKVFAKIQCPMLSEEEIIDIFLSYNGDVKSDFQFSTVPRWGTGSRETKFENSFKSDIKLEYKITSIDQSVKQLLDDFQKPIREMVDTKFERLTRRFQKKKKLRDEWESSFSKCPTTPDDRCVALCLKEFLSDVCFVVGPSRARIPAHKLILASVSPIFHAWFWPLDEEAEIEVLDFDSVTFRNLLRYIYTGNWFLSPYFPSMLYAANKYLLAELRKELLLYIEAVSNNLYYQTALFILDDIILLSEAKAIEQCLKAIDAKAVPLLAWSEFKTIKYATLHCILSRDTLQASEIEIFNAAWSWAVAECVRRKWEPEPGNCRKALADTLYLIRFSLIPQEVFAKTLAKSGLLLPQEIIDIFRSYSKSFSPDFKFSTVPRSASRDESKKRRNRKKPKV